MHPLQDFEKNQLKKNVPAFRAGDTVQVHCKIKEGDKERIQVFEGVVIARHNSGVASSFTVRKVSYGVGVERIFPLHSPFIEKIAVTTQGKVRQSRIYYLRERAGKKARILALDTRGLTPEAELVGASPDSPAEIATEAATAAAVPSDTATAEPTEKQPSKKKKSEK